MAEATWPAGRHACRAPSRAGSCTVTGTGRRLTPAADHDRLPVETGGPQGATPVTTSKTVMLAGHKAHLTVTRIVPHRDGSITVKAKVSGPGRILVMATAWTDNIATVATTLLPAANRFVLASANAVKAGELTLHLEPNPHGRELIERPSYPVTLRVWVSYKPPYARQTNIGFDGLHL